MLLLHEELQMELLLALVCYFGGYCVSYEIGAFLGVVAQSLLLMKLRQGAFMGGGFARKLAEGMEWFRKTHHAGSKEFQDCFISNGNPLPVPSMRIHITSIDPGLAPSSCHKHSKPRSEQRVYWNPIARTYHMFQKHGTSH